MASTKQMLLDCWSPPIEDSEAEHYTLDQSSEEFERRRKKYNVCVIMVISERKMSGHLQPTGREQTLNVH